MWARPEPRLDSELRHQKVRWILPNFPDQLVVEASPQRSSLTLTSDLGFCGRHTRDQTRFHVFAQVLDFEARLAALSSAPPDAP